MSIEAADLIVGIVAGFISGGSVGLVFWALVERFGWLFGSAAFLVAVFSFARLEPYVADILLGVVRYLSQLQGLAQ